MSKERPESTKKPTLAVVIRLEEIERGKLRIVLDDVVAASSESTDNWRRECLYTHFDLDREKTLQFQLPDEHYQRIGELLLARLLAMSVDDFAKQAREERPRNR